MVLYFPHPTQPRNNDLAVHAVENRSDGAAFTLHVYAPPLRKMKLFKETGRVTVAWNTVTSEDGQKAKEWKENMDPDGSEFQ